jgi:hypothetical protein
MTRYSKKHSHGSLTQPTKPNNKQHKLSTPNYMQNILNSLFQFSFGKVKKWRIRQQKPAKNGLNFIAKITKHTVTT